MKEEMSFDVSEADAAWDRVDAYIGSGIEPDDITATTLGDALDGLLDAAKINEAEDPEAERVRQAEEILRGDLAFCRNLAKDPTLAGEIDEEPAAELNGNVLRVIGRAYPQGSDFSSAYWRIFRLWDIGALDEAGIERA